VTSGPGRLADRQRLANRQRPAGLSALLAVVIGGLAVALATLNGGNPALVDALVHPPALIRAGLVGGSATIALMLLARGLSRLAVGTADVAGLVRGVRLVFLALAAAAAGAGWVLGDPLPIVVALVIAGIDVIETSLLLVVVLRNRS
ncbi:MAG: hypothetical protein QOJ75_2513, partial [Chloroflexota bacterium]|jgi:hypothetical protein|nr:hypothetical protein [Chloroflexota bacterium]